ncbi:uncharacterized protein PFL1_06833 [Pseudozyma flocculosa PF-1]|uniref:uncharacterized protein n=1 Tax=Pseudozyma flocculosa PF-1 TaxID=1277687 RepID=UPI0004561175|nr:uncharacterized protein PFL1_06833 [Pseudozyma flocculosa PF-1]EPQ32295.1 hypothetical protein PFL1_06833 [Pseudozyma flocculosa PF-1]
MLASIRRLPLRQASVAAECLSSSSRSSSRLFSQIRASSIASTSRALPVCSPRATSLLSSASTQASISRVFSTYTTLREQEREQQLEEGAQASAVPELQPADQSGPESREPTYKPPRVKDSTFDSMKGHISYPTWKALTVKPFGYKDMSLVQEKVLHLLPELAENLTKDSAPMEDGRGRDLLVKAKTGTGKTIAFLVPAIEARVKAIAGVQRGHFSPAWTKMLERHRPDLDFASLDKHGRVGIAKQFTQNTVGTLILSPTRELATQIATEAQKLLMHHDDLQVQLLVGGASRNHQINDWRRGRPDIIVATPGRLLDLLKDVGMMKEAMSACQTLVLDEADTLLEMGFRDDLKAILDFLPPKGERQTMLFSATVSPEIRSIARASLEKDHRFIDCVPAGEDNVHKHIPQYCTVLNSADEQIPHVLRLIAHDQLANPGKSKVIVFAPTTKMTQMLAEVLKDTQKILPAGRSTALYEIHSKKDQNQRFKVSDRFRKDQSGASILITSDVSARGVDYPGTSRVIQVGIPSNKDQYIHRIGRTGRAGAEGRADLVLLNWEQGFLHFQLDDLPVQKLSVDEMTGELQQLCEKFDESPDEFEAPPLTQEQKRAFRAKRGARELPKQLKLKGPLSGRYEVERLNDELEQSLAELDPDMVREVFGSQLGFYMGRVPELRTTKSSILQGLKQWAVQAGKMEREPFVGDDFLRKLGFSSKDLHGGDSGSGSGGGGFGGRDRGERSFGGARREGGGSGERSFGGRGRDSFSDRPRRGGFGGGSDRGPSRFSRRDEGRFGA